jgi:hypothetical protein
MHFTKKTQSKKLNLEYTSFLAGQWMTRPNRFQNQAAFLQSCLSLVEGEGGGKEEDHMTIRN